MTVSNETARTTPVVGSGSAGQEVTINFPYSATSDLKVYKRVTATGVETLLHETTNYTATAASETGGTLTTVTAIETTETIHIIRNTPMTQTLDLEAGGSFNAENIEDALDRNTKLIIENSDSIGRLLKYPDTDPTTSIGDLPSSIDRASKTLTFDSAGKPTASSTNTSTTVSYSTIGTNIAEAADAATVRGLVGSEFDVVTYGATGDGATDDSAAIQAAIDAAEAAYGGIIFFPQGVYSIQTTLLIEKAQGIRFVGVGSVGDWRSELTLSFTGSCLAWDGDDDGTLLQIRGCKQISFEHLSFTGKDEDDNTKTDALIHIKNHADGTACGNFMFSNCFFFHAESGIQFADTSTDDNSSDVSYNYVGFKNCLYGVYLANDQSIDHAFNWASFTSCTYGVWLEYGGLVYMAGVASISTQWVLGLGAGGHNVSTVHIDHGHAEASGTFVDSYRPGMIYCNAPGTHCYFLVRVTDFAFASEGGVGLTTPYAATYTNVLNKGVNAIFENCKIYAHDFASLAGVSATDRTFLTLKNCKFWNNTSVVTDWLNIPVDSGTHTAVAESSTVLTDSTGGWTADELIGRVIINQTDASYGTITDNTDTTITVASLTGGSDNKFQQNDVFVLSEPWFSVKLEGCLDIYNRDYNFEMPTRLDRNNATPHIYTGLGLYLTNCSSATSVTDFDQGGLGAPFDGAKITIVGADNGLTTITHDATKINLSGGANCTLQNNEIITLRYDENTGDWNEESRSNQAELGVALLAGPVSINLAAAATTEVTLYTVPTGKRCILDHIKLVAGATASPTAGVSFGQNGAETDFLAEQTCSNLAAQYDTIICAPVPNATPVKTKSYAAATVIVSKIVTQDADGGTADAYVYGTLY